MYRNGYIFRYASIMVIIAAALLSTAAVLLKPFQDTNMAIEKMGGILISAHIEGVETEQTIKMFNQYVTEAMVVDQDGNVVESLTEGSIENGTAFKLNMKEQLYKLSKNEPYQLPIYVIENDGQKLYILPLFGAGLWGNLYGNLALKDDLNTLVGVTFSHDKETPGLGAEITEDFFTSQFIGKQIFDDNGEFQSIRVVKGGVRTLPEAQQIHGVDAISGGTITSVGVEDMINDVLTGYLPYLEKR